MYHLPPKLKGILPVDIAGGSRYDINIHLLIMKLPYERNPSQNPSLQSGVQNTELLRASVRFRYIRQIKGEMKSHAAIFSFTEGILWVSYVG